MRDEEVIRLLNEEEQDCIISQYTEAAVSFIRENKERPFILYLAHTAVHVPIRPGPAFAGKSANGRFGDWVEETDWSVGKVLETLRELKLDQNTVVIFTSDNGPWLIKGDDAGSAGPLRDGKHSTWEGGMRAPTIAWWPGRIPSGSVCDGIAGTIDLLPTVVAMAGGKVPAEPVIDGRDISPMLFGKTKDSPREAHYYFLKYELQAVRQGPWKLAIVPQNESIGNKIPADAAMNPRLYNLDVDIGERSNLAAQHPDIVVQLKALAEKLNFAIGGENPRARRPAGKVEQPKMLYENGNEQPARKKPGVIRDAKVTAAILAKLKPGETLASDDAPQINGSPFTLSCHVETGQRDTIILAHGGSTYGYALHLKAGHVIFSVRTSKAAITDIESRSEIGSGAIITASLAKDGKMTLRVGDQPAVTGNAPGLIKAQPQDDFCLGLDTGSPVTVYSSQTPFHGKITGLKLDVE
jgi:hypothetical protein